MEEILIHMLDIRRNRLQECLEEAKTEYESGLSLAAASQRQVRLKVLIQKLQEQINSYTTSSANPQSEKVTEAMELLVKAEDYLLDVENALQANSASVQDTPPEHHAGHHLAIRLPKLELPKFNGESLKWFEFWDRFQSNIDNQPMAEADKLTYLLSSLEGKALEAVAGLAITNHNYTVAIEALKSRYGSSDTLIDAHYTALANLERAEYSAPSCRRVLDEIERHLRVLEKLGENISGNHLRATILSKFPEQVLHQYHLMPRDNLMENNTAKIRGILRDIVLALERARLTPAGPVAPPSVTKPSNKT